MNGLFMGVLPVEVIAWGETGTAESIIRLAGQVTRVNASTVHPTRTEKEAILVAMRTRLVGI